MEPDLESEKIESTSDDDDHSISSIDIHKSIPNLNAPEIRKLLSQSAAPLLTRTTSNSEHSRKLKTPVLNGLLQDSSSLSLSMPFSRELRKRLSSSNVLNTSSHVQNSTTVTSPRYNDANLYQHNGESRESMTSPRLLHYILTSNPQPGHSDSLYNDKSDSGRQEPCKLHFTHDLVTPTTSMQLKTGGLKTENSVLMDCLTKNISVPYNPRTNVITARGLGDLMDNVISDPVKRRPVVQPATNNMSNHSLQPTTDYGDGPVLNPALNPVLNPALNLVLNPVLNPVLNGQISTTVEELLHTDNEESVKDGVNIHVKTEPIDTDENLDDIDCESDSTVVDDTMEEQNESELLNNSSIELVREENGQYEQLQRAIAETRPIKRGTNRSGEYLLTYSVPLECFICTQSFERRSDIHKHLLLHTGEKPYKCDMCEKSFARSSGMNIHRRIHTDERPYRCSVCGSAFKQSSALGRHQKVHSDARPHICDICNQGFYFRSELNLHRRAKHDPNNPNRCSECGEGFGHPSDLKSHMTVHLRERPIPCDECSKTFKCPDHLRLHKRSVHKPKSTPSVQKPTIHQLDIPTPSFRCSVCNKEFKKSETLKNHLLLHTGEAFKFRCEFCGKNFTTKQHLKKHDLIHTGERNYQCKHCLRLFAAKDTMERHVIRRHTDVRPYTCPVCHKHYASAHDVKRHETVHTGEKPHKCDKCGKDFRLKNQLTKHERKWHPPGAVTYCNSVIMNQSPTVRITPLKRSGTVRFVKIAPRISTNHNPVPMVTMVNNAHIVKGKLMMRDVKGLVSKAACTVDDDTYRRVKEEPTDATSSLGEGQCTLGDFVIEQADDFDSDSDV